jgi:hypothetical protein
LPVGEIALETATRPPSWKILLAFAIIYFVWGSTFLAIREDRTAREEERKVRQFYSQGLVFKNQVKVQKGKIVDIQNHMTSLKNRFASWSVRYAQDSEAQACWTSAYYTTYYRDWCDRGRNLKAQYEQLQRQLAQERPSSNKCRRKSAAQAMATASMTQIS